MPPTYGNGPIHLQRCVNCAFQAQQRASQLRRLRTTARQAANEFPLIRRVIVSPDRYEQTLPSGRNRSGHDRSPFTIRKETSPGQYPRRRGQHLDFESALESALSRSEQELSELTFFRSLAATQKETEKTLFSKAWKHFTAQLAPPKVPGRPFFLAAEASPEEGDGRSLRKDLGQVWAKTGIQGLRKRIQYNFIDMVIGRRLDVNFSSHKDLANLRYPSEWWPTTRALQRVFHLHVGPTNSGKTYQALKRIEESEGNCAYAGPLRLLAHEVYSRLNAKGIKTALFTGDDRRWPEDLEDKRRVDACTVEMLSQTTVMDVCVIDEIQLLGDPTRGWAWTQAVLGVKAKEIHLCGEERAIPMVEHLCAITGEKLHIHRYERLSPLQMAPKSLGGKLTKLQKGDCIVSFSVMGIHALRRQIEKMTGSKVATVYGALPPETRAQQAKLFNDPDNDYDYLVASDAVGMGLNLAIKRVIFETTLKFDGTHARTIDAASIKQIGGRAGRYRTSHQANKQALADQELSAAKGEPVPPAQPDNVGATNQELDATKTEPAQLAQSSSMDNRNQDPQATEAKPEPLAPAKEQSIGLVTTLEDIDYSVVKAAMESQPPPLRTVGIAPPPNILEKFSQYFPPDTPTSYVLTKLCEISQIGKHFHLCSQRDSINSLDMVQQVSGLSVTDRYMISQAPMFKDPAASIERILPAYARCIAEQTSEDLTEIREIPLETLDLPPTADRTYLQKLETLHNSMVLYLWLSYRFAGVLRSRQLAKHVKELTEEKIEWVLRAMSFTGREKIVSARREKQRVEQMARAAALQGADMNMDPADVVSAARVSDEEDLGADEIPTAAVDDLVVPHGETTNGTASEDTGFGGLRDFLDDDEDSLGSQYSVQRPNVDYSDVGEVTRPDKSLETMSDEQDRAKQAANEHVQAVDEQVEQQHHGSATT